MMTERKVLLQSGTGGEPVNRSNVILNKALTSLHIARRAEYGMSVVI